MPNGALARQVAAAPVIKVYATLPAVVVALAACVDLLVIARQTAQVSAIIPALIALLIAKIVVSLVLALSV
jgi:hypothetical protein